MRVKDFRTIPGRHFGIRLLLADPPFIARERASDCRPAGLPVTGRLTAVRSGQTWPR